MISGNFCWLVASSKTELISPGFLSSAPIVVWNAAFFSLFLFFITQDIRMNARKERILPPDEIEDLHDDDSDFLKSFEIKSKINFFFQIYLILTINNKNIIKTKKKINNSIKTIISVMTAKKKKEKKVMEEKRLSLPEVVTVRKRPRTPGVTLNRLSQIKMKWLLMLSI